jgi:hypothetical protein
MSPIRTIFGGGRPAKGWSQSPTARASQSSYLFGLDVLGDTWGDFKKGWGVVHETVMPIAAQIPVVNAFVPLADTAYSAATGAKTPPRGPAQAQQAQQQAQQAQVAAQQAQAQAQQQQQQARQAAASQKATWTVAAVVGGGLVLVTGIVLLAKRRIA